MKAAIGQPINLSLCVYAVFWEGNLWTAAHTASAWEVSKQRNHAMLQKAVFRLAMPWHPGYILFTFAFQSSGNTSPSFSTSFQVFWMDATLQVCNLLSLF
jgi:hypothetical protein